MRILAVDPGTVRVGLALSDEGERLATPLATLRPGRDLGARVVVAAREAGAELVVVGLPRRLDGSEGPEALGARGLAAAVVAAGLPAKLWDERFTSVMAEAALREARPRRGRKAAAGRRADTDRVAAAVLLQSFLDSRRPSGSSSPV
ncbi:MAG TPA: Holliday junction resolvase RuvX [Candidatus Dormibacteraeota bacterium]|nr:Holliday junction resolvase RuvX [Candidatus Dormibacteraeota bacterium]